MSTYRTGKACGEPPSRPAAGRHQPVPHTDGARGPIAPSRQFPDPITVGKNSRSPTGPHAQFRVVSFPERTDPLTGDYR